MTLQPVRPYLRFRKQASARRQRTMIRTESTSRGSSLRRRLGLSVSAIVLLAAIAAIRVPLHDLSIVNEGSAAAWLLVFVPLAIWVAVALRRRVPDRKSTRLNSSHANISYAVFCLKKKKE